MFITSFVAGIKSATRSGWLVALLYVITLLLALPIAMSFRAMLASSLDASMGIDSMLRGFDFTVFGDFMRDNSGKVPAFFRQIPWLIFVSVIINTFVGGGVLAHLTGGERFRLSEFFGACGKFAGRFVRLLLYFFLVAAIVFIALGMGLGSLSTFVTANATSEKVPMTFGLTVGLVCYAILLLIVMVFDYAKVDAVVNDRKAMWKSMGEGARFVFQHFLSTVGLELAVLILGAVFIAASWFLDDAIGMTSAGTVFLMFLIQQAFVFAKSWTRLATFGSEVALYRALQSVEATEIPTGLPQPSVPAPVEVVPSAQEEEIKSLPSFAPPIEEELAAPKRPIRKRVARKPISPKPRKVVTRRKK